MGRTRALAVLTVGFVIALGAIEACGTSDADRRDAGVVDAADVADAGAIEARPTPFTEQAMRAAADAFNAKYCPAFQRCNPGLFELTFGPGAAGTDACKAAGGLVAIPVGEERYFDQLTAPYAYGSRLTPDALRACAAALDLSTCEAWVKFSVEHFVPDACKPAFEGSLAVGEPCGAWNQCATGRCVPQTEAAEGACGVCAAKVGLGQICGPCAEGLTCRQQLGGPPKTNVCVPYGDVGAPCNPERGGRLSTRFRNDNSQRPCREHLVCNDGGCTTPPVTDAGDEPCDVDAGCSVTPSFRFCDPITNRCKRARLGDIGDPCGDVSATAVGEQKFVACAFGRTCTFLRTDGGVDQYECRDVATKTDGQECVATPLFDNHCKSPSSRCFNDRCRPNGPAQCNAQTVVP